MNADDAFKKLLRDKKLTIPLAEPAAVVEQTPLPVQPKVWPGPNPAPTAMRVDSVIDGEAEYTPQRSETSTITSVPTETGLDPVPAAEPESASANEEENLAEAYLEGASIIGRDVTPEFAETKQKRSDADARLRQPRTRIRRFNLACARRVKRFAYLPVADIDEFESSAMEMAVAFAAADPDRPSLLITSGVRGEGRTELALRLALAMARRVGAKILLADFDLKNPQIAARLGIPVNYFSIAEALRGTCTLEEALLVSDEDNLYVLPARPSDRMGDEVVDNRSAANLFADIHKAFDFAVIDSGPIELSEAQIVCRHVGSAAIAGLGGSTRARRMERAAERAEASGARVAGMVLTGI